jgi:cobalt-zinc-cadmium efflux system protein
LLDAIPEIQSVHHVHAWTVGGDDSYVTLHVCAADSLGPDSAVARVQLHLAEHFGYRHVTVQGEYGACLDQGH